jgi:multisubunit Na+/H+ antiporter MnhB subunit
LAAVGTAGTGLIVTFITPAGPEQPATTIETEYWPAVIVPAPTITGFCTFEVNVFGPVQLYVAPALNVAVRLSVWPAQRLELLAAVGAAGIGLTVTLTVVIGLVQPNTVWVTEYVPLADVVAAPMVGFCTEDVNELGPDQPYESAPFGKAVKLNVCPAQMVELLAAVGVAGIGLIVTLVTPAGLVQPNTV